MLAMACLTKPVSPLGRGKGRCIQIEAAAEPGHVDHGMYSIISFVVKPIDVCFPTATDWSHGE